MVLWEITLGTAYFLGLKRTYRLSVKLQRRIIGPNHPKIRQFVCRRIRGVFDVAVSFHKKIQQRDIEVGRSLGNWILCWLDRMKPSAQIRAALPSNNADKTKNIINSSQSLGTQRPNAKITELESDGRLFASPMNLRLRSSPTLTMIMRPPRPAAGSNEFYRHVHRFAPHVQNLSYGSNSVFREDIALWKAHHR